MRSVVVVAFMAVWLVAGCACGPTTGDRCTRDSDCSAGDSCVLGRCSANVDGGIDGGFVAPDIFVPPACPGGGATTISGVVRIPAGTLPVPGAVVYVSSGDPPPIPTGVDGSVCLRCDAELTDVVGEPTRTAVDGTFTLNAPAGAGLRIVIQIGKWRRVVNAPLIVECVDNPLDADSTRLPRNSSEGHIPRIALTTGSCDGMECLLRKLGIDDSEFTTPGGGGRINLFSEEVCSPPPPPPFPPISICEEGRNAFEDGTPFPDSSDWWASADNLDDYDVVIHSCECSETIENKPPEAMTALQQYADRGGRVFLTHYHYAWLESSTDASWRGVATWDGSGEFDTATGQIVTDFPRGMLFADWMMLPEVGGSSTRGNISLSDARQSLTAVNAGVVQPWITIGGIPTFFSFDTPFGAPDADTCGRVVFSDIHVSAADQAGSNPLTGGEPPPFPEGCTDNLLAQEKALIFLLFDLTNCVGVEVPF